MQKAKFFEVLWPKKEAKGMTSGWHLYAGQLSLIRCIPTTIKLNKKRSMNIMTIMIDKVKSDVFILNYIVIIYYLASSKAALAALTAFE